MARKKPSLNIPAQDLPQRVVLPPVLNVRDFQFRIVDEQKTNEGNEIRMDLMHPLLPLILVFPFDRLVFADFVRTCQQVLTREETPDGNGSVA